ncbi:MAG TPA: hypothetical protein DIW50_10340 [Prolixibacteraceae bacterium]|nr:hypothetical protein [Prolixibacteraceae bacterium]
MVGIPNQDFSEMFQLRCMEMDDRLSLSFSNHGRPMNVREVKDFSVDDMEGTADGLSLRLLRGLCDELSFQNLGREGWELAIQFKFKNFKQILGDTEGAEQGTKPDISYDFTIRLTTYEDIPGIINLVYNTYRYSYPKPFAYDQALFQEEINSGRLLSLVVATADGKIIGHQAVMLKSPNLGEIGMAMIDPQYRRSRAFILLKKATFDEIKLKFPNLIIYVTTVTSHKASQAFMSGFTISMLELSLINNTSYVGMNTKAIRRESAVYGFMTFAEQKFSSCIYVPTEHVEMIGSLLHDSCFPVTLERNTGDFDEELSVFETVRDNSHHHTFLNFQKLGTDFATQLRKQTRLLQQEDMVTLYVSIPTHVNQPKVLDRVLMENGYFFSGLQPNSDGNWNLYYTNLLTQKFSFDDLQLFSPKAVELSNYMKALYYQTI